MEEINVWVPVAAHRVTARVVSVRRGIPAPVDMDEVEWDDAANAIRLRFLPSQQGQFAPVEWEPVDEENFDL